MRHGSTFVDQQLHILARSWNGGRGNHRYCRFVLRALSPLLWSVDKRTKKKTTKFWRENSEHTTSCLQNSETWTFHVLRGASPVDGPSYHAPGEVRQGNVSYRLIKLIGWLVLSNLQSSSAVSNSSADMLIFLRNYATPNSKTIGWSRSTSGNLLNGIESCSIFVQQRSTTFNMLNGIFQHSASHDTLFNISWTVVATFVAQPECWTVYHSLNKRAGNILLWSGIFRIF